MSDVEGLVDWVDSLWTTPCPHGGSYARDCYRCIHETLYASPWLAARVQAARAEAWEEAADEIERIFGTKAMAGHLRDRAAALRADDAGGE